MKGRLLFYVNKLINKILLYDTLFFKCETD